MKPETTAIVLIEYQNDFPTLGGVFHDGVKDVMQSNNMLANTVEVATKGRAAGATVEELILYKTIVPGRAEPRALRALQDGLVDAITFASGSAVRGFLQLVGARSAERSAIACLGPTAAGAAMAAGFVPDWRGEGEGLTELCDGVSLALRRHND